MWDERSRIRDLGSRPARNEGFGGAIDSTGRPGNRIPNDGESMRTWKEAGWRWAARGGRMLDSDPMLAQAAVRPLVTAAAAVFGERASRRSGVRTPDAFGACS